MSQTIQLRPRFDPLFVIGVTIVLASLTTAGWMLTLGDVVTALGLSLLVLSGLLLAGIGRTRQVMA